MASPLTTKRNDYTNNRKESTIYTPLALCQGLADVIYSTSISTVLDLGCGDGRLSKPYKDRGCYTIGVDVENVKPDVSEFIHASLPLNNISISPSLIVSNPPFNNKCLGRKLLPEVWLKNMFELFGTSIPVVMFMPMGFRLNQRIKSNRYIWFQDCGAEITSIISLPLDIFPSVEFHNEIICFNIHGIKPHYWIGDVIKEK